MLLKSLTIGVAGLFVLTLTAWAGTCALEGVVKDASGQPIKGADVRIEATNGTNFSKIVKSDSNGHYISDLLPVGTYKVTVVVNGSVKASIVNAKTKLGSRTQLNFNLTARTAPTKTHRVWVPPDTGTHIGNGTWVEVDENGIPVNTTAGVNNVEKTGGAGVILNVRPSRPPGQ